MMPRFLARATGWDDVLVFCNKEMGRENENREVKDGKLSFEREKFETFLISEI